MATIDEGDDLIPTERIAFVAWFLTYYRPQKFTTAQLAEMVDMEHNGMWKLLNKAQRKIPLLRDIDGWWIE